MVKELKGENRLMIWSFPAYHNREDLDQLQYDRLVATGDLLATAEEAVARLADRIARSWTSAQAQAVMWRLLGSDLTHMEVAERWMPEPVTYQSVSKHLARAGWSEVETVLKCYKKVAESTPVFAAWLNDKKPVEPR